MKYSATQLLINTVASAIAFDLKTKSFTLFVFLLISDTLILCKTLTFGFFFLYLKIRITPINDIMNNTVSNPGTMTCLGCGRFTVGGVNDPISEDSVTLK